MSTADLAERLADVRTDERLRYGAMAGGVVVGLAVAWFHWMGVFLGGALVALPTRSLRRGVAAGVGFGVLVLVAHLATLARAGVLDPAVGAGLPFYVSLGVGLVFALVGSLVRGVV